jgi:hypothetical protein
MPKAKKAPAKKAAAKRKPAAKKASRKVVKKGDFSSFTEQLAGPLVLVVGKHGVFTTGPIGEVEERHMLVCQVLKIILNINSPEALNVLNALDDIEELMQFMEMYTFPGDKEVAPMHQMVISFRGIKKLIPMLPGGDAVQKAGNDFADLLLQSLAALECTVFSQLQQYFPTAEFFRAIGPNA